MNHQHYNMLQSNLLAWFDIHGRSLPWRQQRSLYGTWVSEIMLQQTTVAAVVPYWGKFMDQFPDVQALAAAPESEVLSSWSGLGYYRRARNLHKAARVIMEEYGGVLPATREQWQTLPGVGAYASGAIASIGLGEKSPAVDANAKRVLSRWFFADPIAAGNLKPAELEKIASGLVSPERPGHWNEAVMELGATLCRASSADCNECPVLDQCRAGLAGVALDIPPTKKSEPAIPVALTTIVVRRGDKLLLCPPGMPETVSLPASLELGREDISGLHRGLWTLPSSAWFLKTGKSIRALENPEFIARWLKESLGYDMAFNQIKSFKMASFRHSITRYRLIIRTWEIQLSPDWNGDNSDEDSCCRFTHSSENLPVSTLVSKSLKLFDLRNV